MVYLWRLGYFVAPKPSELRAEEDLVTYFLCKLRNLRLPPHQLRALGLPEDWFKQVSPSFVRRVLDATLRYEEDLRLLAED